MPDLENLSATPPPPFSVWREHISISGEAFRRRDVLSFAEAVAKAVEGQAEFGVRIEPDPENPANPEAVRIVGYTRPKLVPGETVFHVGFLEAALSEEVGRLTATGSTIAAKLRAIEFVNEQVDAEDPINIVVDLYTAPPASTGEGTNNGAAGT